MASKKKHAERSHRSYHNPKPFADFEKRAVLKTNKKARTASIMERLKSMFHRTTNK